MPVELLRNLGQKLASVLGVARLRVGERLVELGVGEGEAEVTFQVFRLVLGSFSIEDKQPPTSPCTGRNAFLPSRDGWPL